MDNLNVFVIYLVLFRLSIIAAGIISVILGYRLFIKGVFPRGDIPQSAGGHSVDAEVAGAKFKLLNAAPGTCFALFGAIILVAMFVTGGPEGTFELPATGDRPVDNFRSGQGGLSASINTRSGKLGPGAMVNSKGQVTWHAYHPESKAPIQGVVVPAWRQIRARILEYADRFAFAPCIGWDIVLKDSGFSIIEGNSTPGLQVLQIHGPILTDQDIRRFYKYHKVIS